jgi:arylsulfatase A-like enzyme
MRKFSFNNFKIKKILLICVLIIATSAVLYYLWKYFIFLPDDFNLSRKEAIIRGDNAIPEVIDFSMIENIDRAVLAGDYSRSRVLKIINNLKSSGFLIKDDSFITSAQKHLTFRFGTGLSGIWVDERSSVIIPAGCSLAYNLNIKKNSRLELSAISPLSGSTLLVEVLYGSSSVYKNKFELSGYKNSYNDKDKEVKLNNIGYPKAVADPGWKDITINLHKSAGGNATIRFTLLNKEGCVFLGNPRLFRETEKKRYNVIYIIMDGIATSYYSFYNSNSNLTPAMKKAAEKDFIIFDNLFTLGDKTRISLSGLFTSVMPPKTRHGINRNYIPENEKELFYKYVRDGRLACLPDEFRKAGYISTQIGNSGFTVHLLSTGVDYGFDRSYEFSAEPYNSFGLSHRLFEFLRKNDNREFFLYAHYNTSHKPFYAPINYYFKGVMDSPMEAWWRPDFTACIRYADDIFSHIYEALKKHNLLGNSIIVITTDHGAGFDISKFDGGTQYLDYTRQSFMIHIPDELKAKFGIRNGRVKNYLSAINTSPTLLELAGVKKPKAFTGRSFIGLMNGKYTKEFLDSEIWAFGRKQLSVITPDFFKYTLTFSDADRYVHRDYLAFGYEKEIPFELLYNIKNDPLEKDNLSLTRRDILKKMRKIYFEKDFHHPEKTVISFFPSSSGKKNIDVDISCKSPFIGYGLYDSNIKFIKENLKGVKSGNGMRFTFTLTGEPLYLIFENDDDRAPVQIFLKENGRLISAKNIFTTNLNTNISGNPVTLKDKIDYIILNDTKLPVKEDFYSKSEELRVKIVRIDLHRWIDIGKFEATGINAGMKETLKAWGYIQ